MSATGLDVFDTTLHQTHSWLKQVAARLDDDRRRAYRALRGTPRALRDRLTPELAIKLGAQLPMLVRGIYYEGWRMPATPVRDRHGEGFLDHVAGEPRDRPEPSGQAASAVLAVPARELDPGEIEKVVAALPADIRALWHAHMAAAAMDRVRPAYSSAEAHPP